MPSNVNAIVINGYVGKELTLEYLNKMLIEKGINVMYLRLDENDDIIDILINDKKVEYYTYKKDEVIFDEFDIVSDVYELNKCDVLITKSSRYNIYLKIILYVISKYNFKLIESLRNNNFLTNQIPVITAMQSKDVMDVIYRACNTLKITPFISEHFHYSYIKYDIGINMDYAYLSFALALNTAEICANILQNNGMITCYYPRVKMYGLLFNKFILPASLKFKFQLDSFYYKKVIEKYNMRFYCNTAKTASSTLEIIDWFSKASNSKNIKICIFHISPNLELIDIVNNLCSVKYNSVYIIDYNEIGCSYKHLLYMNTYNIVPEIKSEWTETIYDAFAKKISRNITIDNPTSIIDWVIKYAGLHDNIQFDILCVGSKKMINDIVSKIN
jgi:hypothetical protein